MAYDTADKGWIQVNAAEFGPHKFCIVSNIDILSSILVPVLICCWTSVMDWNLITCSYRDNLIQWALTLSIFFDTDFPERKPSTPFPTIACNIDNLHLDFCEQIRLALETKRALVGAPMWLNFEEFILKPSWRLPLNRPVMIIIYALDEGYNEEELLKILCNKVPKVPRTFHVLVTC